MRLALGAGRGRLIRQMLTESVLLALTGGAAGVLLAWLVLSTLRGIARTALPAYADLTLDGGVVLVTAVLSLCTGLAFGLAPALSVDRSDPQEALRTEMRGASEEPPLPSTARPARGGTDRALRQPARRRRTARPQPVGDDHGAARVRSRPCADRDRADAAARLSDAGGAHPLPGAVRGSSADAARTSQAVADVSLIPTAAAAARASASTVRRSSRTRLRRSCSAAMVSDDYFRTLRIPLRQGRTFDARDRLGAPPTVVISESMARRYWPQGNALGARIRLDADAAGGRDGGGRHCRRRAQRSRPAGRGADALPIEPAESVAVRRIRAAHGRRSAGAAQAHGARARGHRSRARAAARDVAARGRSAKGSQAGSCRCCS